MRFQQKKIIGFVYILLLCSVFSCMQNPAINTSRFPGTKKGAKDLLQEFTKPGTSKETMDGLTEGMRPSENDFNAIFNKTNSALAWAKYKKHFFSNLTIRAGKGEHWMRTYFLTSTEINTGNPAPEMKSLYNYGYNELSGRLNDGLLLCHFVFTKADYGAGNAYHALIYVNNHWVFINDPWSYFR